MRERENEIVEKREIIREIQRNRYGETERERKRDRNRKIDSDTRRGKEFLHL